MLSDKLMVGKICVITGATSGIGLATAKALAELSATVIIIGRNQAKCERVCKKIKAETGNTTVEFLVADLSVQNDILQLATRFKRKFKRLDVLVNNAGAKFVKRCTTADGYEMTFALNHLAYFFLTQLMLKHLQVSGHARIVNVSSGAHSGAVIDFEDLQNEKKYIGKKAYNQSKLANLLFTYELSRRLKGRGVTVNAMAPGGVITNFCRNNGWISWAKHVTAHILKRNLISPEKAAETIVYLCSSPEVERISGQYYSDMKPVQSSPESYDQNCAKALWDVSLELLIV